MERILKKTSEQCYITGGAGGISHSRPAAATHLKNDTPSSEIFEMLCVISAEKALQFYYCNRTQFAEIFYIIADTANRK